MQVSVDTMGHLRALHVTPADAKVGELAEQVQQIAGETVESAYVDQGHR